MMTITRDNKEMFKLARIAAAQSPDLSRKTGVVLYTRDNVQITACNDFPLFVKITPDRLERPAKYVFTEHAERNAIYKAARIGLRLSGSKMWLPWFPCADCARAIVQVGIIQLTVVEPDWTEERYGFKEARTILEEGGVLITFALEEEGDFNG